MIQNLNAGTRKSIQLRTGVLEVVVDRAEVPVETLTDYAARNNPNRGFLFVSQVLGRELPVRPTLMHQMHERLAAKIPADLPGPVLFIGMAEYAICLGQGIWEDWCALTGRQDALYTHSTRYALSRELAVNFLEEHSHAPSHLVYYPVNPADRAMFENARSLVLIDDEASTGKTFLNLVRQLISVAPNLSNVTTVVITDWRGDEQRQRIEAQMPVSCQSASLLEGSYSFEWQGDRPQGMPNVIGSSSPKDALIGGNYGRLGCREPLRNVDRWLDRLHVSSGDRVLVLGTAEFTYPPFRLALMLEQMGCTVDFQSTTRNPLLPGNAITSMITFQDGLNGIPSFLYNLERDRYDHVLLCHESAAHTIDPQLVRQIGAQTIEF